MKEAQPKKSMKTEASKIKAKKVVVSKTKKGYTKKSFKAVCKMASRISKKSTILNKSETKNNQLFLEMNFKAKRYFQLC